MDIEESHIESKKEIEEEDLFDSLFGKDEEIEEGKKKLEAKLKEMQGKKNKNTENIEEKNQDDNAKEEKAAVEEEKEEKVTVKEDKKPCLKEKLLGLNKPKKKKIAIVKEMPKSEKEIGEPKRDDADFEEKNEESIEKNKNTEIQKKEIMKNIEKDENKKIRVEKQENAREEKKETPKKPVEKEASEKVEEEENAEGKDNEEKESGDEDLSENVPEDADVGTDSVIKPDLRLLQNKDGSVGFIGRKKAVYDKYGEEASLFIGKVDEPNYKKNICLDGLNPHVVFVCGARGTGKSYVLGVLAEELALKNKNIGQIVIDPIGVFWSMKFPNKEEKELQTLKEWGLKPKGLETLKVFIPKGVEKNTPKGTYDATYAMQPSLLTPQDWCLTFGIDRFSPTGLLLDHSVYKIKNGFRTKEGKVIKGLGNNYSLEDIIFCMENDADINSRDRGYKPDSIRALTSRFDSAKSWGIFDKRGTPLSELSKENQLTIIDTSFLDDNVSALVIGILARRILAARKISTRHEAAERFDSEKSEDLLEIDIPPTWLFIDEAHTLMPAGNVKTAASESLIEYVKQGRRPGCSVVFATQQPSSIDSKVLSQLDVIIVHKLVFNDDIKAVFKRTPTIIPAFYKRSSFIKTLPVGKALVGDRVDDTSRAFVMLIRPRMSQHEGREAESVERRKELSPKNVENLAAESAFSELDSKKNMPVKRLEQIVKELNEKYSSAGKVKNVLDLLLEKGAYLNDEDNVILLIEEQEEKPMADEHIEEGEEPELGDEDFEDIVGEEKEKTGEGRRAEPDLLQFSPKVNEKEANMLANKYRQKGILGIVGKQEFLENIELTNIPVFKVIFNYYTKEHQFKQGLFYINSLSGEFLQFAKSGFIESEGLKEFYQLKEDEIILLNFLGKSEKRIEQLMNKTGFAEQKCLRLLDCLKGRNIVGILNKNGIKTFKLMKNFDLPSTPLHPLLNSLSNLEVEESEALMKIEEKVTKQEVISLLKKIWPNLIVQRITEIYWPVYQAEFKQPNGQTRTVTIDAITGKKMLI
ncbi:MAG: hypothetical protein COT15_04310 [Candidatus Diapherotrites archaeon CG08_land_8_20_14_0_20_34_12]|nr:MAG: hypothetical protein COT15_04310 [Candidatus Diapherotrites archaeon CG08_land_8_20_14_0_20_34_12]